MPHVQFIAIFSQKRGKRNKLNKLQFECAKSECFMVQTANDEWRTIFLAFCMKWWMPWIFATNRTEKKRNENFSGKKCVSVKSQSNSLYSFSHKLLSQTRTSFLRLHWGSRHIAEVFGMHTFFHFSIETRSNVPIVSNIIAEVAKVAIHWHLSGDGGMGMRLRAQRTNECVKILIKFHRRARISHFFLVVVVVVRCCFWRATLYAAS